MPVRHDVQQGDCLSSIGAQYGISWDKIWNYGENADLKQRRKDPNVLFVGDVVVVPDIAPKEQACAADKHHEFKAKRKPTRIKIRLTIDDEPRKNLKFELQFAGAVVNGSTDGSGFLEAEIPPDAQSGVLLLGDKEPREIYQLGFGTLDPIETNEGIEQRLTALGFDTEEDLPGAIRSFQASNNMQVTGTVDDALRQKLKEQFGQ